MNTGVSQHHFLVVPHILSIMADFFFRNKDTKEDAKMLRMVSTIRLLFKILSLFVGNFSSDSSKSRCKAFKNTI